MDRISLNWAYCYQGKSMEELRYSLLYTTLELETTRLEAQEEIRKRDDEMAQLREMLSNAIRERDEIQEKYQKLFVEKLLLLQQQQQQHQQQLLQEQQQQQQQQQQQEQEQQQQLQLQQQPQTQQTTLFSGVTSIEDEPCRRGDSNTGLSSSDCEESIVSSPVIEAIQSSLTLPLAPEKPLPEKGKFLQAVIKAGPLLQTLLLAGPLPQWRHPPPQLDSIEIPPVAIPSPLPQLLRQDSSLTYLNNDNCGHSNQRKRSLITNEGSDSFNNTKYQRIVLH